ncbi:MAG: hypothetical protein ACRDIX_01030 [Actinomycetota bacterium]
MTGRRATILAWGLVAISVVVLGVSFALTIGRGSLLIEAEDPAFIVAGLGLVLGYGVVGALVASRRPGNPIGWLLLTAGLSFVVGVFTEEYVAVDLVSPGSFPATVFVSWLGNLTFVPGVAAVPVTVLLFPSGRPPSPRWRPVVWVLVGGAIVLMAAYAVRPGGLPVPGGLQGKVQGFENPVGIGPLKDTLNMVIRVSAMAILAAAMASVVALIVRFRRARAEERLQIKWLAYVVATTGMFLVVSVASLLFEGGDSAPINEVFYTLSFLGIAFGVPAAIGIAILRYRLYDIDRIINRTLVYGLLTVLLAGVYVGAVVGLGALVGQSTLLVAASTLLVAALFRPARERVQGLIDRRFYRRKYDAARTLEAFTGRLREQVDLDSLTGDLVGVVRDTMQPSHAWLWLREIEATR